MDYGKLDPSTLGLIIVCLLWVGQFGLKMVMGNKKQADARTEARLDTAEKNDLSIQLAMQSIVEQMKSMQANSDRLERRQERTEQEVNTIKINMRP